MTTYEFDRVDIEDGSEIKRLDDGRIEVGVIGRIYALQIEDERLACSVVISEIRAVTHSDTEDGIHLAFKRARLIAKREGRNTYDVIMAFAAEAQRKAA